jgi:sulfopyruvate decarboxylase TPP-binding subunit
MTEQSRSRDVVESVPAELLHREVLALGVSHVLSVPDTHQRTLLASLTAEPRLTVVTLATEDEAICVNAGLWIGGAEALVVIQNVGLFAAMNALRGVSMDMQVPTCLLVGQYGRDVTLPVEDDPGSATRLIEPLLQTIDVPFYRIDRPQDVGVLKKAFEQSRSERRPVVALVGAPTS